MYDASRHDTVATHATWRVLMELAYDWGNVVLKGLICILVMKAWISTCHLSWYDGNSCTEASCEDKK